MEFKYIHFFLILSTNVVFIQGLMKITNIECKSLDPSFCEFEYCRLKAIGRDKTELSMNIKLLQTPITNITSNLKVFKRYNGFRPFLFDVESDLCKLMEGRKPTYTRIIFGLIAKYSNMNHSCPYDADIILEKFSLTDGMLKVPLPSGVYRTDLTVRAYTVPRALVKVTTLVKEESRKSRG